VAGLTSAFRLEFALITDQVRMRRPRLLDPRNIATYVAFLLVRAGDIRRSS
jgi:hypothetical protein